jgi:hypothetical protein
MQTFGAGWKSPPAVMRLKRLARDPSQPNAERWIR